MILKAKVNSLIVINLTGKAIGLDVGLNHFYTDSTGATVPNPRYLRFDAPADSYLSLAFYPNNLNKTCRPSTSVRQIGCINANQCSQSLKPAVTRRTVNINLNSSVINTITTT